MDYLLRNTVQHGRCQNVLSYIEPNSVSLSLWSPPYFVGKDYETEETYETWQTNIQTAITAHVPILKAGGFMVVNMADVLCFKDENIPRFQALVPSIQKSPVTRDDVVRMRAQYPNASRYELAKLLGCSEQTIDRRLNGNNIRGGKYLCQTRVKLVGNELERYAYNVGLYLYDRRIWVKDPAWANSNWVSSSYRSVQEFEDLYIFQKPGEHIIDKSKLSSEEWTKWGSRGVWNIKSVRQNNDHDAKFPLELAEKIILLFSNKADLVLDPFLGSGTSAIAALKTGRDYIGIEQSKKYFDLANLNISQSKLGFF